MAYPENTVNSTGIKYIWDKITALLGGKVDKITGKGLSTNDYTTAEKNKLAGIEAGAQVNPTIDSALSGTSTNPVQNKVITGAISESETEDNSPYLYRPTLGDGDRVYIDDLVGASFGWNQIGRYTETNHQNASYDSSTNVYTLSLKNTAVYWAREKIIDAAIENHVYYAIIQSADSNNAANYVHFYDSIQEITPTISGNKAFAVVKSTFIDGESRYIGTNYVGSSGPNYWASYSQAKVKVQCFDLTLMFGTTIADYVYSLEQATAGSGIAWLKSYGFFTKSYYPYNAGSIASVKTSGKKYVGKNLWDEKYENISGTLIYLPVFVGDNTVTMSTTTPLDSISAAELFIFSGIVTTGANSSTNGVYSSRTRTVVASDGYVTVAYRTQYGANPKDYQTQLEIGSQATTYEPYTEHTYPTSNTDLRGIPTLSGNKLVYDGDVYSADGNISRKYGIVDLGTLTWMYWSGDMFYSTVSTKTAISGDDIISDAYPTISHTVSYLSVDKTIFCLYGNDSQKKNIYIADSSYSHDATGAASLKTALSEKKAVIRLATPTTESADPYIIPQICDKNGTEEFIDTRDVPIPVGHDSRYVDLPDWMENGYIEDLRHRVDETLPNAISALASTAVKVIAKNGEYDAVVYGLNDMPNCSLSLDKGTYFIMAWCYFTAYNIDTNKEYGCAICDSSNTILSYDGHRNRTESAEGNYGATSSTFILETITTDATVRKLRGYMCKSVTGNPIKGGIVAFKIA